MTALGSATFPAVIARLAPLCAIYIAAGLTPATAETFCAPRSSIIAQFAEKFGEHPKITGLSVAGTMIEILTNDRTGAWTALETRPDGVACMVSSGTHLHITPSGEPT